MKPTPKEDILTNTSQITFHYPKNISNINNITRLISIIKIQVTDVNGTLKKTYGKYDKHLCVINDLFEKKNNIKQCTKDELNP